MEARVNRTYAVILDSKGKLVDLDTLTPEIAEAARRAVNAAADRARSWSADIVRRQINFPASYVSKSEGRLVVKAKAKPGGDLSATVSARTRNTSLARFTKGGKPWKRGAQVEVKPGVSRYLRGAVFVPLKKGTELTDTVFNLGLAVRTRNGQRPDAAYKPVRMKNGLWLLYGPSVSQALLSAREQGIWPKITPQLLDFLEQEFNRQLRLNNV